MISARDFFFKYYSGQEDKRTYSETFHSTLGIDLSGFDLNLKRSNDILLNSYMDEILKVCPDQFRDRISFMFIAKLHDFSGNAGAVEEDDHYGDLIFFNVGMSDAFFQYSPLFYEMVELSLLREELGDDHPLVKALHLLVTSHTIKLARAQDRWIKLEKVKLTFEDNVIPSDKMLEGSVNIACAMDRFVLYHEIAHHLLGHTSTPTHTLLDELPEHCCYWTQTANQSHQREFQADAGAILLSLWASKDAGEEIQNTAALGSLLAITVFGQFVVNADVDSESHPSAASRFQQATVILTELLSNDSGLPWIMNDVRSFQRLVGLSQNRGIGVL